MKTRILVAAAVMLLCVPVTVQAVDWDNPSGSALDFDWANGQNSNPLSLFGSPTWYGGNDLYFLDSSFVAYDNDGGGTTTVTDTMDVDFTAHVDKKFLSIAVWEYGDYNITGGTGNTVTADLDMSGTVAGHPMSPFEDDFLFSDAGNTNGTVQWNDTAALLMEFAVPDVTALHLSVTNTLIALSDDLGGTASITGNFMLVGVSVTVIPEPTSLALLALGGLAVTRRRKR